MHPDDFRIEIDGCHNKDGSLKEEFIEHSQRKADDPDNFPGGEVAAGCVGLLLQEIRRLKDRQPPSAGRQAEAEGLLREVNDIADGKPSPVGHESDVWQRVEAFLSRHAGGGKGAG